MHDLFGIKFLNFKLSVTKNTVMKSLSPKNKKTSQLFFLLKNSWNNYKLVKATQNLFGFIINSE